MEAGRNWLAIVFNEGCLGTAGVEPSGFATRVKLET